MRGSRAPREPRDTMQHLRRAAALLWMLAIVQAAAAQETAPYPNGTSGIKAGTVPPPGYYWLIYNRLYEADEIRAPDGSLLADADITGFANVHRFVNVTEHKILGADFAWNCVVPLVAIDSRISTFGVDNQEFRIGDLNLEPFILEWHEPRYDFGYLYGLFAPTASRDDARPALPGKAHWTHYVGAAGTYYFDDERTWSASILSRYEIATRRRDKDITAGDNFSFEWGLARNFNKTCDMGVSGFCSWQTTLDRGADVTYTNVRDHVYGIGPEINYFSTKYKLGYQFRCWWELDAVDRTQGTIATLTFVKPL